jgi:hypothetical protein
MAASSGRDHDQQEENDHDRDALTQDVLLARGRLRGRRKKNATSAEPNRMSRIQFEAWQHVSYGP